QNIIQAIRTIRSEMNVNPGKKIPLLIKLPQNGDFNRLQAHQPLLTTLAKIQSIQVLNADQTAPISASAIVDDWEFLIPMSGLIEKDAELARLQKEMAKIEKEIEVCEKKLGLPTFIDKAPKEVVIKEREKLEQAQLLLKKRLEHQAMILSL
ncbi:MAG: valyl-tRNA synthetase, partial [Pseudomonadota bacterium]|nr:valyl-tRNA synthetase [Pseudomonadota bacterium]